MTITHALIKVASADHRAVVNFYAQALKPLGSKQLANFPNGMTGFGSQSPEWWIAVGDPTSTVHVAFGAPDKAAVDAFHTAAIDAGAKDNGSPGPRAHIHPNYYAAFILDPMGNNIEAGCMVPDGAN
ncbi:Glyoxalase/Bleomycin resistance protein/Dihydroxybiphenyl dioxygenase [Coniochaeta sp. PMI_546]|nr:Glyoxalase/Bleomycin resistance protein/Dihydroxybiphenyl dioxygenase [Coniochaeta sp. PMI_546]